jgi:ankyrin repeat protein
LDIALIYDMGGHEAVVALLLDTDGVDVDVKDNKGRTPLFLAAEKTI